jgi:hypothetical protein
VAEGGGCDIGDDTVEELSVFGLEFGNVWQLAVDAALGGIWRCVLGVIVESEEGVVHFVLYTMVGMKVDSSILGQQVE